MPRRWLQLFEGTTPRICSDLETLVRMESPSDDPQRVSAVASWVRDRLRERGVAADLRPCPPRGEAVLASVGAPESASLLLGHHDTVWPAGTLATFPFRMQGERATGPGIFDMKAGIAVAMAVLAEMAKESRPAPLTLLLIPDEEVGTAASRELLLSVARRHRQVLVLEPSEDGAAKVARKGTGTFEVTFTGKAAHAGLEPEKGASALAELARFLLFVETLADRDKGTTVTATVAQGGTTSNVVPERATLTVDARVWSKEEGGRIERALGDYRSADPRVFVNPQGHFDRPPMQPTPASEALYARARKIALALGFEMGAVKVGGASDGNLTAAAGLPTLDGLGPRGGGAHSRSEHVDITDLPRRAALVAALVSDG